MNCRTTFLSASIGCLVMVVVVPFADAAAVNVKTKRCGTAELTQQPSDDPDLKLYLFKESGALTPVGVASNAPLPGTLATMNYVCQGLLAKGSFQQTASGTLLTRSASAACTFTTASGDRVRMRATSAGGGTSSNPPHPAVKFEVLHGTGRLAGIKGGGTGDGFLPISDQSNSPEVCARVDWKIRLPAPPHGT